MMESIEIYHTEHCPEPDLVAAYAKAHRSHDAVNPGDLQPGPRWRNYDRSREIAWRRATDLSSDRPVLVPHVRVNMNWSRTQPEDSVFCG